MSASSIEHWDESTLRSLIQNQVQESIHLDYKRSEALENTETNKNEISKDVSSFANSDGGIIIYGIEESGHIPTRIDGMVLVPGKREWLEQVINSRIEPKIDGVRVKQIDLTSHPGSAVFVVQIPIGFTAHQAHDLKYYRRHNFQAVPMHDYEVKMIINRFREPIIELAASLPEESVRLPINGDLLPLILEIKNRGKVSAQSALVEMFIPDLLTPRCTTRWLRGPQIQYEGLMVLTHGLFLGLPNYPPIFPGREFQISGPNITDKIYVSVNQFATESMISCIEFPIFYEIYAADMAPRKGKLLLRIKNRFVSILCV